MQLITFSRSAGREIKEYGSNFVMSKIVTGKGPYHVGCMYFDEGDFVGRHDAVTPQLLFVVQGQGWVSGEDGKKHTIKVGEAAFWITGESHEAGTESGMMSIVIEGEGINPSEVMEQLK